MRISTTFTTLTIALCFLIAGTLHVQGGNIDTHQSGGSDNRDIDSFKSAQRVLVKSILSKYNPSTLTAVEAKSIHQSFRDAGLGAGPNLNEAVIAAGFSSDKLRDLDPPPGGKIPKEVASDNKER